jgi:hypothetical protein
MFGTGFELLVGGVLAIYVFRRVALWMNRRGWIRWKMRRGTSSELGNAVLGVQSIFQPSFKQVQELRMEEEDEQDDSGEPPSRS